MHLGIILIGLLSLVSWCIQILPVISVPITGLNDHHSLYLSRYQNLTFGVFGVCDTVLRICSPPKIGYSASTNFDYWNMTNKESDSLESIRLPSSATHFISKLLVVHVVAFIITGLLMLECALTLAMEYLNESNGFLLQRMRTILANKIGTLFAQADVPAKSNQNQFKRRDLTRYLNVILLSAVSSFILNLLAFLVDILLFVPELSVLGWIQLLPVLLMALVASLTCFLKRSILSRRHLDEELFLTNSMRRRSLNVAETDDSGSDDGIYIYTNGFLSGRVDDGHQSISSNLYGDSEHIVLEMETLDGHRERDSFFAGQPNNGS